MRRYFEQQTCCAIADSDWPVRRLAAQAAKAIACALDAHPPAALPITLLSCCTTTHLSGMTALTMHSKARRCLIALHRRNPDRRKAFGRRSFQRPSDRAIEAVIIHLVSCSEDRRRMFRLKGHWPYPVLCGREDREITSPVTCQAVSVVCQICLTALSRHELVTANHLRRLTTWIASRRVSGRKVAQTRGKPHISPPRDLVIVNS